MNIGSVIYQCPSCSAALAFDTATQSFACEYCGGKFTQPQLDEIYAKAETDMQKAFEQSHMQDAQKTKQEQQDFYDANKLYMCPTCGAQVITDSELSASAICHYCHNPVVLAGRLEGEYRPDKIIPFKKTKEDALTGFEQWISKRKTFLAKGFASPESLEKIQGIYVPFWLADCLVDGNLSMDCYKTVSTVRTGDYVITTEEKYVAERCGTAELLGIPLDGSSKADDVLMESIEPFDYSEMIDFNMAYLAGHNAEKYDITKEQVQQRAVKRATEEVKKAFKDTVKGYTRTDRESSLFNARGINWKYCLLPMWFMTYHYKGKMYYYAMNGQTGKFGGTLPVNKAKLILFSYGVPALLGLTLGILMLLWGGKL